MIFKFKKHNTDLYNTLLKLSRNVHFYENIKLKDSFETRIYLMFMHFSIILIVYKKKSLSFDQSAYDNLFYSIENNLRELGFGDVSVNKKMKDLNKILYDMLLKIKDSKKDVFVLSKSLVVKYFDIFSNDKTAKYQEFSQYFVKFYNFCFELPHNSILKRAINFKH
jgi:cytochrome b pre-mRNA-processing protein 3